LRAAHYHAGQYLEGRFDRRYGTDTLARVPLDELQISADQRAHAEHYQAITAGFFRRMVRALPFAPAGATFIDLGAGKGRALMLAAEAGFCRVVGVELCPRLHAIAERNLERYTARSGSLSGFELYVMDAATYAFPAGDLAVFLYNPFGPTVVEAVMSNLAAADAAAPARRIAVLYREPRQEAVIARQPFLGPVQRTPHFVVYANQPR
jgi:predicted RNA methylase